MKILLDTNVLIWWLADDPRLGSRARSLIADDRDETLVSIATFWEMSIKWGIGKMENRGSAAIRAARDAGFRTLDIGAGHLELLEKLELVDGHNDPFDRIILAQAKWEAALLMTSDRHMRAYDVRTYDKRLDR
jgi:PIN domain nuclease of toxin-antitoxin system